MYELCFFIKLVSDFAFFVTLVSLMNYNTRGHACLVSHLSLFGEHDDNDSLFCVGRSGGGLNIYTVFLLDKFVTALAPDISVIL